MQDSGFSQLSLRVDHLQAWCLSFLSLLSLHPPLPFSLGERRETVIVPPRGSLGSSAGGEALLMKCPKPECPWERPRNAGVWEGGCTVVFSSGPLCQVTAVYVSRKRRDFFKEQFLDAFSLYFIVTSFFVLIFLEYFDLKKRVVYTSCKSFSHLPLRFLFPCLSHLLKYILSLTWFLLDKEKWKICKTFS